MEMFAAVLKDQYAAKDAQDGRTTYHIAIMPCTAKKMEPRDRSSSMTQAGCRTWC